MSTKIYNGYYSDLKLEPLLEKFKELVITFKTLKEEAYSKTLVAEATNKIDKESLTNNKFSQRIILADVYKKHRDDINESKNTNRRLFDDIDFEASCCLFPCGKKTLILFYSDNRELTNAWESLDYIHDYHYQDQCDKPDNISNREWSNRYKNWNKVLGGNGWGIPSENGYKFTFTSIDLPYLHNLLAKLPSYVEDDTKRAENLVYEKYVNDKFEEAKKTENVEEKSMSIYNSIRKEWAVWKETESYKESLIQLQKNLVVIDFSHTEI